ncbi:hypothetical protein [Desertivirga xinjiangensis]|uniref:hypothetical protein n=1 Tax=Desertivirga xinjiangensis TaxID=539206 RepID=UPI00210BB628|nr:hypothetical protein [Pedobacter xinjiangensis]
MNNTIVTERDLEVDDKVVNFIIENLPHGGYATVATKLSIPRRNVRDEILSRRPLYNKEIINALLELIEFVTGQKPDLNAN